MPDTISLLDTVNLDLSRPSQVRDFLRAAGFRPSSVLGQNFLIDRNVLDRMLESAAVQPGERILEVGPGLGVLTGPLLASAGRLVAVEKDARLYEWLCKRFADYNNVRFVLGDYLDLAPGDPELRTADALISNLPYAVAARILAGLALSPTPPSRMLFTVQKEVAERLAAGPSSRDYGLLSVLVGEVYDAEIMRTISPSCFYPAPAVWSAFVRLRIRPGNPSPANRTDVWLPLVRHAFSRRRKQMTAILTDGPWRVPLDRRQALKLLLDAGIVPTARPENLGIDDWRRLAGRCAEFFGTETG